MRYVTLAASLAFALATFSMAPAKAELSGVFVQNGLCRTLSGQTTSLGFYTWDKCPTPAAAHVSVHHHRVHKG